MYEVFHCCALMCGLMCLFTYVCSHVCALEGGMSCSRGGSHAETRD